MVVLGLVLLVMAAVLGVGIVVSNPAVLDLSLFGARVPVTMAGVFFTGVGTTVVVVLALLLVQRGIARSRRQRRTRKNLPGPVPSDPAPTPRTSAGTIPAEKSTAGPRPVPEPAATGSATARETVQGAHAVEPATSEPSTSSDRTALLAEADRLTHDDRPR